MNRTLSITALVAALTTASFAQADEELRRQALATFGRIEAPAAAAMSREAELGRALHRDRLLRLP